VSNYVKRNFLIYVIYILSRVWVTLEGVMDLAIGFIDHLSTRLRITSNYRATRKLHKSQITNHKSPQHTLSLFQPLASSPALPSVLLLTVEILQLARLGPLWMAVPFQLSLFFRLPCRTGSVAPLDFFIAPLQGPNIKHSFHQYLYYCMRIRCLWNVFTEPLPRNELCFRAVL
jgi:hypothetical protein